MFLYELNCLRLGNAGGAILEVPFLYYFLIISNQNVYKMFTLLTMLQSGVQTSNFHLICVIFKKLGIRQFFWQILRVCHVPYVAYQTRIERIKKPRSHIHPCPIVETNPDHWILIPSFYPVAHYRSNV